MANAPGLETLFSPNALMPPPDAIRDYCVQTVNKAAELNRSMLNSLSQAIEGNFDLAKRLIRCNDPAEALVTCKEWLNARCEAILADSKGLATQWLKLCDVDLTMAADVARRASDQVQTNVANITRAAAGD